MGAATGQASYVSDDNDSSAQPYNVGTVISPSEETTRKVTLLAQNHKAGT